MTMTTTTFLSQKREEIEDAKAKATQAWSLDLLSQALIWGSFVKMKGLSIYCQNCKAWVDWAKANQKAHPSFMEIDKGPVSPLQPGHQKEPHRQVWA